MNSAPVMRKGSPNAARKCFEFGHRNKAGLPCGANVIKGTSGCRRHSGTTLAVAKAKGAVVMELRSWGLDGHTELADPGETLLRLVTQSRARCEFYADLLRQAYEAADRLKAARAEDIVSLEAPEQEWVEGRGGREELIPEDPALQTARADLQRIFSTGGVAALIGHKYDADRLGRVYPVDEGIRGLAALEAQERDRCAGFAAKAVAAGLGERMVRLAERQGALLFAVIIGVLRDLGLPADTVEVRQLIGLHITRETGVGVAAPAVIDGGMA